MRFKQLVKPVDIRPVPFARSVEFLNADNSAVFASLVATGSLGSELLEIDGDVKFINNVTVDGSTVLGNAAGDDVTSYASDWTLLNDPTFTMGAGAGSLRIDGGIMVYHDSIFYEQLSIEGSTILGNAVGDSVTSNAGIWTFPNATTINFDAATALDATGQTMTCKGTWTFPFDTSLVNLYGDTLNIGWDETDEMVIYSGIVSYESDVVISYGGTALINYDDPTTLDATGETVTSKGTWVWNGRLEGGKGSDIASADEITLGLDGNYFDITGSTEINHITETGWQAGAVLVLQFDASVIVKHNTASTPPEAPILLSGAGDFSATADDTLQLVYDGAAWREISRTVI